jgi:nitrate reductase NapE component
MTHLSEVPSVATLIVGIFAVIIIGAAGAFAYLVFLADDGGQIGP